MDKKENIDIEILDLVNTINCIPGIETTESCCGHGLIGVSVFFDCLLSNNLFILAKSCSKLYCGFGGWSVIPCFSETYAGKIYFCLSSESVGEKAYEEAKTIIKNIQRFLQDSPTIVLQNPMVPTGKFMEI